MTTATFPSHIESGETDGHAGATRGAVSLILRLESAAALAAAVVAYRWIGGGWAMFALLFLVPDLSMAGYLAGRRIGAAVYNLGHTYLSPAALAAAAIAGHATGLLPLALIWCAHIGLDRALGYGLKYPQAFQATHLGRVGRRLVPDSRYAADA